MFSVGKVGKGYCEEAPVISEWAMWSGYCGGPSNIRVGNVGRVLWDPSNIIVGNVGRVL